MNEATPTADFHVRYRIVDWFGRTVGHYVVVHRVDLRTGREVRNA